MNEQFPWNEQLWANLVQIWRQGRLPHALLFTGQHGMGKRAFTDLFAQSLLCEQPDSHGRACATCKSCQLMAAGNHPDLRYSETEDNAKQIKIDQIRELIAFIALKSHYGRTKLAIINPAEKMNRQAANCLLKTLEEPPGDSLIILITHQPMYLPATVRSRCQNLVFESPRLTAVYDWLARQIDTTANIDTLYALSKGAPLTAVAMANDGSLERRLQFLDSLFTLFQGKQNPVMAAKHWLDLGSHNVLSWLVSLAMDMARIKSSSKTTNITHHDTTDRLQDLVKSLDLRIIFHALDIFTECHRHATGQIQINEQTLLEDAAIQCAELGIEARR